MPLGAFRQSLNLANPVAIASLTYRGYVYTLGTTVIRYQPISGTNANFTHNLGTVQIIKVVKLPGSNNQIVAVGGSSGRRILHLNTLTNILTSIYFSTAITGITGCDISMDETTGKFYVVFCSSTTTTSNRVRMVVGNISTPTTNITTDTALSNPGAAAYTVQWNPQGTILAVRTVSGLAVYTRSGDTVTYRNVQSLSGGQTGSNWEDISWNQPGSTVALTDLNTNVINRWTYDSSGTRTATSITNNPDSNAGNMVLAYNPNSSYLGVLAVMDNDSSRLNIAYYNSDGAFNSFPSTGVLTVPESRQLRWSPIGDKLALINNTTVRTYNFTYSLGQTASNSFPTLDLNLTGQSHAGFDFVYY